MSAPTRSIQEMTNLCGRNDMFCGGVPIESGTPRILCPFDSSTSVIGIDKGCGLLHAAAVVPMSARHKYNKSSDMVTHAKESSRL